VADPGRAERRTVTKLGGRRAIRSMRSRRYLPEAKALLFAVSSGDRTTASTHWCSQRESGEPYSLAARCRCTRRVDTWCSFATVTCSRRPLMLSASNWWGQPRMRSRSCPHSCKAFHRLTSPLRHVVYARQRL
jgi:hypothetical protein